MPQSKTIKTEKMFRGLQFTREAINEDERTVELSFSSEAPYERWFGLEILDHSPGSIRFGRLNNGGAVLVNHYGDQVGVVERAEIGEGRKGRAVLRFGRGQRADEVFQDIKDGIRRNVSVGYIIHKMKLESEADGVEAYRVTDWEPYEISIVGIPADTTVGVGRSAENQRDHETTIEYRSTTMAKPGEENTDTTQTRNHEQPTQPLISVKEAASAAKTDERKRISEILNMGRKHGMDDLATKAIEDNTSVDAFRAAVLDKIAAGSNDPVRQIKPEIGMSPKEVKRYSIVRAMNQLADKRPLDGVEREASDAVAKLIGRDAQGFFVPYDVQASRALNTGIAEQGGYLVQDDHTQSLIELLRNAMALEQVGVRRLMGLVGNVPIPKITGGATAQWMGESEECPETDQTFGQLLLTPKRIAAITRFSKQLLAQSSWDVESLVRADLAKATALAIDLGGLAGAGGKQPLGLFNIAGTGTVTFGGAPTWADVVEFETDVAAANASLQTAAFLTTAGVRGAWKTTEKAAGTAQWLWTEGGFVNGYPGKVSQQIPGNRVAFGNWDDMLIAFWEGMDVVVDPFTFAANNQIRVVINQFADVGVRHAASFSLSTDAGNQ